ncbi:hypothetical protein C2857_006016 [Epichloe festucae Fl1]|uniref:DUF1754-domain-containing protein n=1 Tax=Epichloe festucae (strain Fl1) TaxID=877507 RepID=A0A7S9PUB3_EPIFF|nr:hypothetical protein C2857_006016 [Epichloe festucae Fl1]
MPSGDYIITGGGALKLKGAKVQKKKKKKRKDKSDLEKNLSTGDEGVIVKKTKESPPPADKTLDQEEDDGQARDDEVPEARKTESERRYEEVKKKRLQKLAESSTSRPELLKTHKERVEELNTYLSKLSEHHDMPKIGPG